MKSKSLVPRRSARKRKTNNAYLSPDEIDDDHVDNPSNPSNPVPKVALNGVHKKRKIREDAYTEARSQCQQLLTKMMNHEYAHPFNQPVEPISMGVPDYYDKIKKPMDFLSIQKRLDIDSYKSTDEFAEDMRLVFTNCWTYNLPSSDICYMANVLSSLFEKQFKDIQYMERNYIEDSEASEMKSVVTELRMEHQKLLAELQKLVRETQQANSTAMNQTPTELPKQPKATPKAAPKAKPKPKPKKKAPVKQAQPRLKRNTKRAPKFDYQQKEELRNKIRALSISNMEKMVELLVPDLPEITDANQANREVEIDLESFSDETLQKLENFVASCAPPPSRRARKKNMKSEFSSDSDSDSDTSSSSSPSETDSNNDHKEQTAEPQSVQPTPTEVQPVDEDKDKKVSDNSPKMETADSEQAKVESANVDELVDTDKPQQMAS